MILLISKDSFIYKRKLLTKEKSGRLGEQLPLPRRKERGEALEGFDLATIQ